MKKILFTEEAGNKLVEKDGEFVGVINPSGKFVTERDFREFVQDNKLGRSIKFAKNGKVVYLSKKILGIK